MANVNQTQGLFIAQCVRGFRSTHIQSLATTVQQEFQYQYQNTPKSLMQLILDLGAAETQLSTPIPGDSPYTIDDSLLPLVKRCVIQWRRSFVAITEIKLKNAAGHEIFTELDKQLADADLLANEQWFQEIAPMRMPRLTDYVTLQRAEAILDRLHKAGQLKHISLPKTAYDDKFGILSPPSRLAPELEYWREKCDLREVGLALAYFDIDNFKKDFNTRYSETAVDRDCLPVIMRAIEAHVFNHGSAFHEGGDEFVILIPNATKDYAIAFMDELRCKLPTLSFRSIESKATISIGLCHVEADCFLTDVEIRMKANAAKKHAKEQGAKNCITTYEGEEYSEPQLYKARPKPER